MYNIRDATKEDESFIYSTWLLGLRHGNDWFLSIDKERYFQCYKRIIGVLLENSAVKIACLNDDPDVALGYVVYHNNTAHWLFVKKAWRRLGIAKALYPKEITRWSHMTKLVKKLKPKNVIFDPFFS